MLNTYLIKPKSEKFSIVAKDTFYPDLNSAYHDLKDNHFIYHILIDNYDEIVSCITAASNGKEYIIQNYHIHKVIEVSN